MKPVTPHLQTPPESRDRLYVPGRNLALEGKEQVRVQKAHVELLRQLLANFRKLCGWAHPLKAFEVVQEATARLVLDQAILERQSLAHRCHRLVKVCEKAVHKQDHLTLECASGSDGWKGNEFKRAT